MKRPLWSLIVFRTPKGWIGPKKTDNKPTEGTWRSHQVSLSDLRTKPDHLRLLEGWMKSYRPAELFNEAARLIAELRDRRWSQTQNPT